MRVAVAAILKNEAPYLLEWIGHHRAIGVQEFFLADNMSSDGTTELLLDLQDRGWVRRVPFPDPQDGGTQAAAYSLLYDTFSDYADWIAFIDGDEFIMPDTGDLPGYLDGIARPEIGAITLNWAIYGSSGQVSADDRPVMERFTRRGLPNEGANAHYKSIVRSGIGARVNHPHHATLPTGYFAVNSRGDLLSVSDTLGIATNVCWEGARINHYVVKSLEEFRNKQARGRAEKRLGSRPDSYFTELDINDESDPVGAAIISAAIAEKWRLVSQRAAAAQPQPHVEAPAPRIGAPAMKPDETELYQRLLASRPAVVEFGMGGSTVLAARRDGGVVHSIESDTSWVHAVSRDPDVRRGIDNRRVYLHHAHIGKTQYLGYPADESQAVRWPRYYTGIWDRVRPEDIDMVFVDGRFRVASALTAVAHCRADALVVIHDFWSRDSYHCVLEFTDVLDRADDLAVLRVKPSADWRSLALVLQKHALDCR